MARPERHDIDYFPFYIKDGRTLNILESKYGCKGTGFFTNVLRFLGERPDHYFCVADPSDWEWFLSRTHCDAESALDMLNLMVKSRKLSGPLWVYHAVIASESFLESLQEAYRQRKNECVTINEINGIYGVSSDDNPHISELPTIETLHNSHFNVITSVKKPQSKVKESKVNKITLPVWIDPSLWDDFLEHRKKLRAPMTNKAQEMLIRKLEHLKSEGHNPKHLIMTSMERGWKSVFPPNEGKTI